MRFASFDISSTPEDQYQTLGARTDVLALRVTLSQLPQQDLIGDKDNKEKNTFQEYLALSVKNKTCTIG